MTNNVCKSNHNFELLLPFVKVIATQLAIEIMELPEAANDNISEKVSEGDGDE